MKVSGGSWQRTRLCGCGECYMLPTTDPCPMESSKSAKWLWASKYEKEDAEEYLVEDELVEEADA